MDPARLNDVITKRRLVPVVVPGYRFQNGVRLFSAILVAEQKRLNTKQAYIKAKRLMERPDSLLRLVSTNFRPIVGYMVPFCDDRQAVKTWSEINQKRVVILTVDPANWTYVTEFDTCTDHESIELLKTTEDGEDYYHVLLQPERLLGDIKIAFGTVKKYSSFPSAKRQRTMDEFDCFFKKGLLNFQTINDVEMNPVPVVEDIHFKPDKTWLQLSQIQKDHLHQCDKCAYPYYNALPKEECLLTIRSHLMDKDLKVSPYQHLFVTAENFQLGDIRKNSHLNLYYLNHVKDIKKNLTLLRSIESPPSVSVSERNESL